MMEQSLNRWCYFDERKDQATKDDFEKNFLRCIKSLDRAVGKIMQSLKDLDLDVSLIWDYIADPQRAVAIRERLRLRRWNSCASHYPLARHYQTPNRK